MHFFFDVSIPAGTAATSPYEEILLLSSGEIRGIEIYIPSGHKGRGHLQLLYHEFQVYPLSRGEDYHGDNSRIAFTDRFDLETGPYEFKVRGWNTDASDSHAFLIGIDIEMPDALTVSASVRTLASLRELVGSEV